MPRTPVEDSTIDTTDQKLEVEDDEAVDLSALPPS